MKYYTTDHHSTYNRWEPCNARTLRGAKCAATRRHGQGYIDMTIQVGIEEYPDHPDSPIRAIAEKPNYYKAVWRDLT